MDLLTRVFNRTIDTLQLGFAALFDLPLSLIVPALFGTLCFGLLVFAGFTRLLKLKIPGGVYTFVMLFTAMVMVLLLVDRRLHQLSVEVAAAQSAAMAIPVLPSGSGPTRYLFPKATVDQGLPAILGEYTLGVEPQDAAIDFVSIRATSPEVRQLYLAIADLTAPGLTIHITPSFDRKTLVSDFARSTDSVVAINGEAGRTAGRDAELGQWTGNWIVRGEPVLLEDTDKRPFLSFDVDNRPTYSPAARVDRELTPEKYNTLWGRYDLLVDGEVAISESYERTHPYPRTIMGVDEHGTRLYLLVADGKRPGHSVGLGLEDAANILRLFGAHDAMKCDQGGSSCMYLRSRDSIVNRPADRIERRVYTHFGVSVAAVD